MNKLMKLAALALLLSTGSTLFAQEKEEEKPVYQITETAPTSWRQKSKSATNFGLAMWKST